MMTPQGSTVPWQWLPVCVRVNFRTRENHEESRTFGWSWSQTAEDPTAQRISERGPGGFRPERPKTMSKHLNNFWVTKDNQSLAEQAECYTTATRFIHHPWTPVLAWNTISEYLSQVTTLWRVGFALSIDDWQHAGSGLVPGQLTSRILQGKRGKRQLRRLDWDCGKLDVGSLIWPQAWVKKTCFNHILQETFRWFLITRVSGGPGWIDADLCTELKNSASTLHSALLQLKFPAYESLCRFAPRLGFRDI